jgi:hypothetical protein
MMDLDELRESLRVGIVLVGLNLALIVVLFLILKARN